MLILLIICIGIVGTNYELFVQNHNNKIAVNVSTNEDNQVDDTENSGDTSVYESENTDRSLWDRFKGLFVEAKPELTIEKDKIDVYDTEYKDDYTDKELISMFGVVATDGDEPLDIKVETEKKTDTVIEVKFTTISGSDPELSVTGIINVVHNSKPIITVDKRKMSISQRKAEKLNDEDLIKYIIKKTKTKATDKEDNNKDITLTVDLTYFKRDEPGEYKLKVIATDSAKQTSESSVIVRVK